MRLPQNNISWTKIIKVAAGAVGGAAAIALMEVLAERTTVPLLFVPFATSIVLVMGSPEAEPAQPRALVGGHTARFVPVAMLLGAPLVTVADTVGRTVIAPSQVPAGLVVAIIGAPYFVYLLYRSR